MELIFFCKTRLLSTGGDTLLEGTVGRKVWRGSDLRSKCLL